MEATSRRLLLVMVLAAGAGAYFFLAPRLPTDQRVRFVLGDEASRVEELRVRYGREGATGEIDREVTFPYAPGQAPRMVSHEPRLANGDYVIEMEISVLGAPRVVLEKKVALQGGTTTIDLSPAIREAERPE